MLLYGWWTQGFMAVESCITPCFCVICVYASGYKENFPAGTIKMNWNWEDQSTDTSSSSREQGLSFLLKVPGGVLTASKQLPMFLTKPQCVYPSGWMRLWMHFISTFAKPFLWFWITLHCWHRLAATFSTLFLIWLLPSYCSAVPSTVGWNVYALKYY